MRTSTVALMLWLFSLPMGVGAQTEPNASIEVEVDRSEITIGDRIEYRIHLSYDPGIEVQKPGWGSGLESFQILDFKRGSPKLTAGRWETTDVYTLSTFTPEDYVIPPVQAVIRFPSGATQVLETQPIAVKVASVLPDDDTVFEIKDIRDPVPVYSGIEWRRIIFVSSLVLLALAAYLLYRLFRKGEEEAPEPVAVRFEEDLAFDRLRALRQRVEGWAAAPDEEQCREFGLELSEALREYLERRFDFIALEMTTEQIEDRFRRAPLGRHREEDHPEQRILEILRATDLLKFARGMEARDRLLARVSTAEQLVGATKRSRDVFSTQPPAEQEAA